MNFFDLEHIFVLFPPGAGGNFISGLISKIDSKDLTELSITPFGGSHTVSIHKRLGGDSISFGSKPEENSVFSSIEEREKFYLDKIKNEYTTNARVVTWTHDFSNLLLYKKHFKNCKTLSITCSSVEEQLSSILMHVNKVFLVDEKHITIPYDLWLKLKDGLKKAIKLRLENFLNKEVDINLIFDLRFTVYKDLFFYLSAVELLRYAKLYNVLDILKEYHIKTKMSNDIKELVLNYSDTILPYNYLKNKNINLLKSSISSIFNRNLSLDENIFLENSFNDYLLKQDWDLLNDPISYFNFKREKAIKFLLRNNI